MDTPRLACEPEGGETDSFHRFAVPLPRVRLRRHKGGKKTAPRPAPSPKDPLLQRILYFSLRLSAIMAMNSEFVGLPRLF